MAELVRVENICKDFSGVRALSGVTLDVHSGEILALVGENGAGKSTLMKILSGTYPAGSYSGEIFVDGKRVGFRSPLEAEKAGIAIIHQELSAFPHLTVAENLFVGHWPTRAGMIDWAAMKAKATEILDRVGANIDPMTSMGSLSTGSQQLVEIAKALGRDSKVLILDEPTSSLTPREVEKLFGLLRQLRASGKGLVYISHKMEEIYGLTDRILVLRDGQSVHQAKTAEISETTLVSHMVGRSVDRLFPQAPERDLSDAPVVLELKEFSARSKSCPKGVGPVSFEVRQGEIVGFSGLLGAGRTEMMQAILGDPDYVVQGEVIYKGQPRKFKGPRDAIRNGIVLVSEDRKRESIFEGRGILENTSISRLVSSPLGRPINSTDEVTRAQSALSVVRTKFRDFEQPIRELSGGNQQKVIFGRVLETAPEIIILDEPTRGVDVGAKFEIYQILFALASSGKTILVISSDLPELMALSDRVIVVSEGKVAGTLTRDDVSQDAIMQLAVGVQATEIGA